MTDLDANWAPLENVQKRGTNGKRQRFGLRAVFRTVRLEVVRARQRVPTQAGPLAEGIVHGKSVLDLSAAQLGHFRLENWASTGADEGPPAVATYPRAVRTGDSAGCARF